MKTEILRFIIRYTTFAGNLFPQFLICCLLLYIDFETGYKVGSIWFYGYALNLVIKNSIRKARPPKANWKVPHVNGFSFPSGHSLMSIVLYWSIAKYFAIAMPFAVLFYALPFWLGASRLYLRVHFPEDVLAGWLIAYCYLHFASEKVIEFNSQFYEIFYKICHLFG
ncbi:MAG: phosphatase PAP2 family protein [Candidatus Melainabacteria bacterium]|nr:phosphatase PAP2 family protein [Candidatus Melainabacteria bacterium]